MRKLLTDQPIHEKGPLRDIYEQLVDKVIQISTFHDTFDSIDSLMAMS